MYARHITRTSMFKIYTYNFLTIVEMYFVVLSNMCVRGQDSRDVFIFVFWGEMEH